MFRALNGECNNFIKSVKWNNETRMEQRILKSAELISKTGDSQGLKISHPKTHRKKAKARIQKMILAFLLCAQFFLHYSAITKFTN